MGQALLQLLPDLEAAPVALPEPLLLPLREAEAVELPEPLLLCPALPDTVELGELLAERDMELEPEAVSRLLPERDTALEPVLATLRELLALAVVRGLEEEGEAEAEALQEGGLLRL